MKDLTVIFMTANETPPGWAKFHMEHLLKSVGDYPLITVSRNPMDLGKNLLDVDQKGYKNIYRQLLRAAKEAETPFIAMAEDDTLYCPEHFNFFRPQLNEVAYNMSKWSLYTWDPIYSLKRRKTGAAMIGSREYVIEALEERFSVDTSHIPDRVWGEIGRHQIETSLEVSHRNFVEVYCKNSIIQLSHPNGTEERQRFARKEHGSIKAYDIPYWGKAVDIVKHYDNN